MTDATAVGSITLAKAYATLRGTMTVAGMSGLSCGARTDASDREESEH